MYEYIIQQIYHKEKHKKIIVFLSRILYLKFVWINSFDFYIKKLHPTLSKRKLLTVHFNGSVDANDGLLALAYAVSLVDCVDQCNPAEIDFEENDKMIAHFNTCLKKRYFSMFPFRKKIAQNKIKYTEHSYKDQGENIWKK